MTRSARFQQVRLPLLGFGAVVLALGLATAAPLARAQSVTASPPPPIDLSLMQRRVADLENALREANRVADETARENFRLKLENDRLKNALETAQQAAANPGLSAPPVQSPAPSAPQMAVRTPPPVLPPAPSLPPTQPPASADLQAETGAYNAAISLAPRDPVAAEEALRNFIAAYPTSARVGEATYFLGRTQYVQRKWNAAAQTFLDIVEKTPRARRAPESLIWLGAALREEGVATGSQQKIRTGCGLFRELPERFPSASQSVREQARQELAKAAAPGAPAICANL
jgi:TolA-binding protein